MSFLQIVLLLGCLTLLERSVAEEYVVGGRAGWRTRSVDYAQWSARNHYRRGDSLVFPYEHGAQSVMKVSKDDYHLCRTNNPIEHYIDGNTIVRLDGGNYYFISGVPGHCHAGMKLEVLLAGAPSPSAPPSALPSASPSASTSASPSSSPAVITPVAGSLSPTPSPTLLSSPTPSPFLISPTAPSTAPTTHAPTIAPVAPPAPAPAASTPVPSSPTAPSPSPLIASPPAPFIAPTLSPTTLTPSETPLASSPLPPPASPTGSVLPPAESPGGPPKSAAFALSSSFASILIAAVVVGSSII